MFYLYLLLFIMLGLLCIIFLRALFFFPKKGPKISNKEITFDREAAVSNLQQLVRCKTVSYRDAALEDDAEFQKLIDLLPTLYPHVFETCTFEQIEGRGLLFCWKGKQSVEHYGVLMAHYDVVPVDETGWEKPPFEGIIEDGVMWGRGTLDTKITFNGVLFAVDHLIAQGFQPERTLYLSFSGGEEINGLGASNIMVRISECGYLPEFVLDEGGAVVENVFPGVTQPCGLIGISEKGLMNVEFSATSEGGHASTPKPNTPAERVIKACSKVIKHQLPMCITPPVSKMFDTLGRYAPFKYKLFFANIWFFKPFINIICKKKGGELNALVRSTMAFTTMEGSNAVNVIPTQARIIANTRLIPEDNMRYIIALLKKMVRDPKVKIDFIDGHNACTPSITKGPVWENLTSAIATTWKGCVVSPYLMLQCSDSHHYNHFCKCIYRFSAMDLTAEERASIHGNNERVRLDTLYRNVEFFIRFIEQC